jgi:TonB family protein
LVALQLAAQDVPPRVTYQEAPVYPVEMKSEGLRGDVTVRFVVDREGRVRNPFVLSSTNPGLDQAAIDGVLKWRFEPGLKNGVPVNVRMQVPIVFQMDNIPNGGHETYEVSGDHGDKNKLPPNLRYDIPPKPGNVVFAVYPFELLRDGVNGTAEVRFLVSPNGEVEQATVVKATRPEFGQALLAMIDEWRFQPAMKEGKPTPSVLDISQEFSANDDGDVPVSDEAWTLLHELKKEKPGLCAVKDLDVRPLLLSQRSPVFPPALIGKVSGGKAVVEFLIDHYGTVQLPRIVSATDPAFGYAAVQGVVAWRFAPLTSHGQPVAVRAQVPIVFTSPKPASDPVLPNAEQVFNLSDLDQRPVMRFPGPSTAYPTEMKYDDVPGAFEVGFVCDTDGHVRDAHVVSSSGSSKLDQAAVAGVSSWIFKPGMKDGRAVNVRMYAPISGFNHDDN